MQTGESEMLNRQKLNPVFVYAITVLVLTCLNDNE